MSAVDVVTVGEALVSFRSSGPLTSGEPLVPGVAGAESNVAIALARLGHEVEWVGRVGADPFGRLILRDLRAEGVRTDHVAVDSTAPSGLMFLEQRTADLVRVEYRRAGSSGSGLLPGDVLPALQGSSRVLHVSGVTSALSDSAHAAVVAAVEAASAAGVLVSLDVNYRSRLWGRDDARSALARVVPHCDLVIASDDELDLVAPGDEESATAGLLAGRARAVAVKRGARGASLYSANGRLDRPAAQVTSIDTVGAGDAFCAGLLSAWLDGLAEPDWLDRAILLGAFAVSTRGDWQGLPHRGELGLIRDLSTGDALR